MLRRTNVRNGWKAATGQNSFGAMKRHSPDRIADILAQRSQQLDAIFGAGQYRIEETDDDVATVHGTTFDLKFEFDRYRMRDVGAYIKLRDVPDELEARMPVEIWIRFLGEQAPSLAKDRRGIISVPPDEQIEGELKWVALLSREVFASTEKTRDAAYFVRGYHIAYNDWATRGGSWTED
jgi:hypothetical protein